MKWLPRYTVPILPLVLVLGIGCGPQSEEGLPADLLAAIDAFYAAIEAGDTEGHIAMFGADAIMMPNHWTLTRGYEAIAAGLRAGEDAVFRLRNRRIVDADADGNIAYTVNAYDYTYHAAGDQPQWHRTKNVHIWKKDTEGRWKLHVDIWNSDVPLSQFPNE